MARENDFFEENHRFNDRFIELERKSNNSEAFIQQMMEKNRSLEERIEERWLEVEELQNQIEKLQSQINLTEKVMTENCLSTTEFDEMIRNLRRHVDTKFDSLEEKIVTLNHQHEITQRLIASESRINNERHTDNQRLLTTIVDQLAVINRRLDEN